MTQEEIIKLAQEAGFENYAYEAVGIFERFARLVSAAEREKFTNTQEFVTLPREVVKRALKVLEYAANDVLTGRNAATELRAALEQPDHSEQSYMGCVTSDMHELAEWLNTMYEYSKEQIAALEQPQAEQEPAAEHELKDVRCECCGYMTHHREHMGCIRAAHTKREPLTDEQIIRMVNQAGWDAVNLEDGFGERIRRYTEILEAAHNK